jgi:hypothetical protein
MKKLKLDTVGNYYRNYDTADKYNKDFIKNPEAVDEWMKAYRYVYDLAQRHNVTEWGGCPDINISPNKILTPDEMEMKLKDCIDNGNDFYEIISIGMKDMKEFNEELRNNDTNSVTLKIWIGTRDGKQKLLKFPVIVTLFEMPSLETKTKAYEWIESADDLSHPLGSLGNNYDYFKNNEWDFEVFKKIIDEFDEELKKNKDIEPELLEIKNKVKNGENFQTQLQEFKDKHGITTPAYEPYWGNNEET